MPLHIALAGCGPAGLTTALFLARAGHRVIVFDKMERPAPLGSGLILQPTGLAVLALLGLRKEVEASGCRLTRLFGRAQPSGRMVLDVRYDTSRHPLAALGLHRAALFNTLFEAVTAEGIAIETGVEMAGFHAHSGGQASWIDIRGRRHGPFDLIIDALGWRTPIRTGFDHQADLTYGAVWANVDWIDGFESNALEQRYSRASQMTGLMPIGRPPGQAKAQGAYFWSLRAHEYEEWRRRGLEAWKADAVALWPSTAPLLEQITDIDQFICARYRHATRGHVFGQGIAFVGDSAHATSPQLGQGANMALLDALALARALERHGCLTDALPAYGRMRRRHIRLYQALSRVFTPFYQSDSALLPFLRDRLVSPLSRFPLIPGFLAKLVAGLLVQPVALAGEDPFWSHLHDL